MRGERKQVRLGNVFAKFRLKRDAPINILTRGARTEDEPAVNINIRTILPAQSCIYGHVVFVRVISRIYVLLPSRISGTFGNIQ